MDSHIFKRIFFEEKRTKGFCAPRNLFLVMNFLLSHYHAPIKRASLRRQIKAKWNIDRRENTIRAAVRDLHKMGLVALSTTRPVLVRLDLKKFVLLLTHYYVKTSDRKILTIILSKLMYGYERFLSDTQAFEKNSVRKFYEYVDPIPLEWIVETIRKGTMTQPVRELIDVVMRRPLEAIFIFVLALIWLVAARWHGM